MCHVHPDRIWRILVNKNSHELFLHSWSFRMFGKLLSTSLQSVPVRNSGRAFMVIGSRNSR